MKKKFISIVLLIFISMFLTSCGDKEPEKYEMTDRIKVQANKEKDAEEENNEDNESKELLIDFSKFTENEEAIALSDIYNGLDMTGFYVKKYYSNYYKTLSEFITNEDKPTILIYISPYCGSCQSVDYESFELYGKYNVIYMMNDGYEITEEFDEKGISAKILNFDFDNLAEDENTAYEINELLNSLGTPSYVYLTKEGKIAFVSIGEKNNNLARALITYLE